MVGLVAGAAVSLVTALLFWRCLPRNGRRQRFVGTEWEPYIAVAITTGAILGAGFIAMGLGELVGLSG
jgi:hypothetical protein